MPGGISFGKRYRSHILRVNFPLCCPLSGVKPKEQTGFWQKVQEMGIFEYWSALIVL